MADFAPGRCLLLHMILLFSSTSLHSTLFAISELLPSEQENQCPKCCPDSSNQFQIQKLEEITKNLSEIVSRLELQLKNRKEFNEFIDRSEYVEEIVENEVRESITVTKHRPVWMERFQFISEVRLRYNPTAIDVLPFRDYEGVAKFIAVGDELGKLYLFFRNGDFATEFSTLSESPVTVLLSYLYKNETVLITGHRNGEILMHRVFHSSNGDELNFLQIESVGKCDSLQEEDVAAVRLLELHNVGRTKYILSSDDSARINVFRENGTLHGSTAASRKPLAFLKQRLLFLTETGAGSLDLRTMKIKESECEGLNHSYTTNYIFDTVERSKAYGLTSTNELIHVLLLGDLMNFKCRVRSRRKLEFSNPLVHHMIKGYLLISNEEIISVYNVSSQHYSRSSTPRLLFTSFLSETRSSFRNSPTGESRRTQTPLISTDREKLVVLSLGDGYIGVYRSNLPLYKGETGMLLWTSPVLFFLFFLFVAWYFIAKKKEVLTSWGPEDAFSSDVMNLKGGMGRTRYVSPSRYPFRENCSENALQIAPVESNIRAVSELKFRGSNIDSSGFLKRREGLFLGNQVDDGN